MRGFLVCGLFVLVICTDRASAQEGVLESYFEAVLEAIQTGDTAKVIDELEGAAGQLEGDVRRAPRLAATLSLLSLIYIDLGRVDEARTYAARAREIVERPVSRGRSDLILALDFLGLVSLNFKNLTEAEHLIERAVTLAEDLEGNDYVVFFTVQSLANLKRHAGRNREAEELFKQALAIAAKIYLDPQGIEVIMVEKNLGDIYTEESRFAEAEEQLDAVVAKITSAFGPDHPLVAHVLLSQAELYKDQARYVESERRYQQVLAILKASAASGTLLGATTLSSLGDLYLYMGRYREAEKALTSALSYKEKAFGKDHPELLTVLHNLGALYGYRQRYGEAETVFQRVIILIERSLGPEHPTLANTFNSIAENYRQQGRFAEAKHYFARCVAILEKLPRPREPLPNCLGGMAVVLKNQGSYGEAEKMQLRVLEIWRSLVGPEHPDFAIAQFNIARIYAAQGRNKEADQWFQDALKAFEQALGPGHPTLSIGLEAYAEFLRQTSREDMAKLIDMRAKAIRAKNSMANPAN